MKYNLIRLIVLLIGINTYAQQEAPPQGINYQAVIYSNENSELPGLDASNMLLANTNISVRFSILIGTNTGTEIYSETHATNTDNFGVISLIIGKGNQTSASTFETINWGAGYHFLKVDIDKNGGNDFKTMSTQQLWSVPYSLYSKHAQFAENGISDIFDNGNGTLTFNYFNGSSFTTSDLTGPQGPAGIDGINGIDGTNGTNGIDGADGANGNDGLSAYQIWLNLGNSGTQIDFINSLTGPTGANGSQGPQGVPGLSLFSTMEVFSAPGTFSFTVPSGITKIMIEVWGAGGGGGNSSVNAVGTMTSGSGGGYGKEIFSVTPGTTYSIVVGAGGTSGGGNGGTSSFGSLISATGGQGGYNLGSPFFLPNGGTSSATFNITGQAGVLGYSSNGIGAVGGGSFGSFGGRAGSNGLIAGPGNSPGGGGASGSGFSTATYTPGAIGGNGRVVIWY
jgi:hypothetical protein